MGAIYFQFLYAWINLDSQDQRVALYTEESNVLSTFAYRLSVEYRMKPQTDYLYSTTLCPVSKTLLRSILISICFHPFHILVEAQEKSSQVRQRSEISGYRRCFFLLRKPPHFPLLTPSFLPPYCFLSRLKTHLALLSLTRINTIRILICILPRLTTRFCRLWPCS